jgi:hypothetical protein
MIGLLRIPILGFIIATIGCKKGPPQQPIPLYQKELITHDDSKTITPLEAKTYHVDNNYKYEYRTGISGDYEYNYDVNGFDQQGNEVSGNVNVEGKYGAGIITMENGDEVEVTVEWIDYGKLKATDNEANEYELEVDQ